MQISLRKKFSSTLSFNELRSLNYRKNINNIISDSFINKENSNLSRDKNFVVEMLEEDD
jgi:hypothetical protein